ncbi:uncharacterized protein LAESUDRAFT_536046 [Laetiporus sulphureus 93-53]|uniref:Uncharacterized protein n=1 Tax=Laetiporus sulphureus 93-53 TaxID=1314785 RepID=A0A165B9W2_9APHY|nr:uncharacterized protein LAESUDRAFT_536046 [Laetiporus sulphureus 93-53]KZT00584.1 hypothetical protein LAESUDRAFT_536046 [Laetiporus sulphureus 93-53]
MFMQSIPRRKLPQPPLDSAGFQSNGYQYAQASSRPSFNGATVDSRPGSRSYGSSIRPGSSDSSRLRTPPMQMPVPEVRDSRESRMSSMSSDIVSPRQPPIRPPPGAMPPRIPSYKGSMDDDRISGMDDLYTSPVEHTPSTCTYSPPHDAASLFAQHRCKWLVFIAR